MAEMDEVDLPAPLFARRLLRAARSGALATQVDGQPFAALVTPATAPDLSILLWLSMLSEHTRQLRTEPRCALMVVGNPADGVNPQTAPRVAVTGIAEAIGDAALKARWLAVHPYAALYADFADFSLWRIRLLGGQLVGGFARAHRLRASDLTLDAASVAAVAAAADEIMTHVNTDHPDALAAIAGADAACRMVAVDIDGFDLATDDASPVRRIAFPEPVADASGVRAALIRMARAARAATAT
jgi:putative heme iron utilization protein